MVVLEDLEMGRRPPRRISAEEQRRIDAFLAAAIREPSAGMDLVRAHARIGTRGVRAHTRRRYRDWTNQQLLDEIDRFDHPQSDDTPQRQAERAAAIDELLAEAQFRGLWAGRFTPAVGPQRMIG
jgi:alpha-D-ribose 1-methylphosphonate 5-triphosphate synthase subunit PhnG